MNPYAIDQELQSVADAVSDARDWIRKGDLEQAAAAIDEASGMLENIDAVIGDAICDEAEEGPVPSPSGGEK